MAKLSTIAGALLALAASACTPDAGGQSGDDDDGDDTPIVDEWAERLNARSTDYSAALRSASLKLVGDLPTMAEIKAVADAPDLAAKKAAYEALVQQYLDDPRFETMIASYWRDTFRMGDNGDDVMGPLLESAPLFATMLTLENRSYTELFTAQTGTCPSYVDDGTGTGTMVLTAADCANMVPAQAGLLTHPGVMAHYYSNLAFRRVRFVQETFDCTAFPAEVGPPQDVGGAAKYTAPWDFESIASLDSGGRVDFLDVSAVVCANCHATMNHIAPLFGQFTDEGMWSDQYEVRLPTQGNPRAEMSDWLPDGETTAWRLGVEAADLPALGQAMAADPRIAECAVARAWNFALGKTDIVTTLAVVPSEVIAAQVESFTAGGHKLKDLFFAVFTADDFVKF